MVLSIAMELSALEVLNILGKFKDFKPETTKVGINDFTFLTHKPDSRHPKVFVYQVIFRNGTLIKASYHPKFILRHQFLLP